MINKLKKLILIIWKWFGNKKNHRVMMTIIGIITLIILFFGLKQVNNLNLNLKNLKVENLKIEKDGHGTEIKVEGSTTTFQGF